MPLIFEDEGKKLSKKQAKVPDKLVNKIKANLNLFGKYKQSNGYKRANSIVNKDYNKRSKKKDKIHNNDKTLSFADIKKIDHEYKKMSVNDADANINNLGFILPGGNDMKNWAHDTLRKMRTAVKKVDAVPQVPKLEKNPLKVTEPEKDIKMGTASVKLTETDSLKKKKIIINENQLLLLKEYHGQTVFNFDEEGEPYFQKNNWENYVDFLEEIGTPGTLPKSEWNEFDIRRAIENAKNETYFDGGDLYDEDFTEAFLSLVCEAFIYHPDEKEDFFNDYFLELFNDYDSFKEDNNYYDECQTIRKFLSEKIDLNYVEGLEEYLTYIGQTKYEENLKGIFLDKIYDYDIEDGLTINDRGLIYIERNIRIPYFNSPNFNRNGKKNYYDYLNNSYSDLGNCFSWAEGKGEAYCGSDFGATGSSEIKLKCWVDPKDVDWNVTVYRNCYSLREEQEIYIDKAGAKVEVFDIVLEYGVVNGQRVSGKSLMKTPIIITY